MKKSFILLLLALLLLTVPARSQAEPLLMPIGGGYSDIYDGFSQAVTQRAANGQANILVLPMAYSTNAQQITPAERQTNLTDAEARRYQIEEACKRAAPTLTCKAVLAPVFTQSDANDPANLALFTPALTAVFILGGDQTVAMQVIRDTPFEQALDEAYARGVIVAGTSAGGGMQSSTMLGGYSLNYADSTSLNFGSVDVWQLPERRGLSFGIPNAILDQHFNQRGRLGRLLSAISLPDVPHVGVGVDAYTGVLAPGAARLEQVFGLYTVTVLDAETYHAAQGVQYSGPGNTLRLRNVLVHLLAPGDSTYDLQTRRHSLAAPAKQVRRSFAGLVPPSGAGILVLGGGLSEKLEDHPAVASFAAALPPDGSRVVIASGYPSDASAQRAADKYKSFISGDVQTIVVPADGAQPVSLPDDTAGIILIGRDQSRIQPEMLAVVGAAWRRGVPVLADEAGAAVIGRFYAAHKPPTNDAEEQELATQKSFLKGRTQLKAGLGLLPLNVEPRLLADNRWGRLFSLAYNQPALPALGLNEGAAIIFTPTGDPLVLSDVAVSLDFSSAKLAYGSNEGFVVANGLLDVFPENDSLVVDGANMDDVFAAQPTPVLPSATPGATSTPSAVPTLPAVSPPAATPTLTFTPSPSATIAPTTIPAQPVPAPPASPPTWLFITGAAILILAVAIFLLRRK